MNTEKSRDYFGILLGALLFGLGCNVLCLTGVLPYVFWRWSLAVVVALLALVWLLAGRLHKEEMQFDPITTRFRRISTGVVVTAWCLTFFMVIFSN